MRATVVEDRDSFASYILAGLHNRKPRKCRRLTRILPESMIGISNHRENPVQLMVGRRVYCGQPSEARSMTQNGR